MKNIFLLVGLTLLTACAGDKGENTDAQLIKTGHYVSAGVKPSACSATAGSTFSLINETRAEFAGVAQTYTIAGDVVTLSPSSISFQVKSLDAPAWNLTNYLVTFGAGCDISYVRHN